MKFLPQFSLQSKMIIFIVALVLFQIGIMGIVSTNLIDSSWKELEIDISALDARQDTVEPVDDVQLHQGPAHDLPGLDAHGSPRRKTASQFPFSASATRYASSPWPKATAFPACAVP